MNKPPRSNRLKIALLLAASVMMGCKDETEDNPEATRSFIKLFVNEHRQEPNDMLINRSGGAVLLSTQRIAAGEGTLSYRVRMISTDKSGNTVWETQYPHQDTGQPASYKASAFIEGRDGYFIVGESTDSNGRVRLLLLKTDENGMMTDSVTFSPDRGETPMRGVDLLPYGADEIKIVASIARPADDVWVGTFSTDLEYLPECSFTLSSALLHTEIIKDLYIGTDDDMVIGMAGSQPGSGRVNSRLVRFSACLPLPKSAPFIAGAATGSFRATKMIDSGSGFVFTGTTDLNGNEDIFMAKVTGQGIVRNNGLVIFNTLPPGQVPLDGTEVGAAILQTDDGGFLLGGSTESNISGDSDLVLIKTDFSGAVQWSRRYGDENDDRAVALLHSPDGGYLILATTAFGGIEAPMLIKTDRYGEVE